MCQVWLYFGVSLDGICYCFCCVKRVIEVKSFFLKLQFVFYIVVFEYVYKVDGKYYFKREIKFII